MRGNKPLAECGSLRIGTGQLEDLKHDISLALAHAGEGCECYGYILRTDVDQVFTYGVFRHQWAVKARVYIAKHEAPDWLQGLVFGYSPDAIQGFSDGASASPTSNSLDPCDRDKVEIVRPC